MPLLTFMTFTKILGITPNCKTYKEDTLEHQKCIKLQKLSDEMLKQFYADNKKLFDTYIEMAHSKEITDFMNIVHKLYTKLDNDIYIDMDGLNTMLDSLDETSENNFDFK